MSETHAPIGVYTIEQLDLVRRQISLWETNSDEAGALADWLPEGVLTAPRGVREESGSLPEVIRGWHQQFSDLHVELVSLFGSADGGWLAIEWTWAVTRKSDGASGTTPDAIIVQLRDGKILSWREYFDTFGSVEF
jgi:ketosteroid isomerase-like protein